MKIARILVRSILALGLAGALYLVACIIIDPAKAQSAKSPLTMGEALSMLQAFRNLDGRIVVVKQNGVDTAVTCQISAAATSASDVANTVAFAAGDLISLKVVTSAGAAAAAHNAAVRVIPA